MSASRTPPEDPKPPPDAATGSKRLSELVAECLERLEEEGDLAVERICAEHPAEAPQLRRRLATLRMVGLVDGADEESIPERIGEFRLLRRLGGGGMGMVYLAEQASLGRKVALKVVHPESLHFPRARIRFQREVEAIARLHHAGIVPVFEVGEDRGLPFFTMEWVRGATLAEVLSKLAGRPARDLTGADLTAAISALRREAAEADGDPDDTQRGEAPPPEARWESTCLRLVHELARALDHAHRHGVLHRDLKPSNVMITWHGELKLLDFGLAVTRDAPRSQRMTRTGSQMGSLPYMAPEQVRGEVDAIDIRSDVYALGVTLYELMTLRSPFEGAHEEETRARILEGAAALPRRLNPEISWEAETVCLTAMDSDPARRYPTADALAQDLERILGHRPIAARRPGAPLRLRRWMQRHPAASVALVLGFLLSSGGPLTLWRLQVARTHAVAEEEARTHRALEEVSRQRNALQQEQAATEAARVEADAARELAERNFDRSLDMVSELLAQVGYLDLQEVPRVQQVRLELIDKARRSCAALVDANPRHARARLELARIDRLLGQVLNDHGDLDRAGQHLEQAIDRLTEIDRETPGDPLVLTNLSLAWSALGTTALRQGRLEDSRACTEESIEVRRRALDDMEARDDRSNWVTDFRFHLARTLLNLGVTDCRAGNPETALDSLEEASELLETLVATHPSARHRESLAVCCSNLAASWQLLGNTDEAAAAYRRSLEVLREQLRQRPDYADHHLELSHCLGNLALCLGSAPEASELWQESLEHLRLVQRDFPLTHRGRSLLSWGLLGASDHQNKVDRPDEALELLDEARPLLRALSLEYPENPEFGNGESRRLLLRAMALQRQGDLEAATEEARQGVLHAEAAAKRWPDNPQVSYVLVSAYTVLTDLRVDQGQAADAAAQLGAWLEASPWNDPDVAQAGMLRAPLRIAYASLARAWQESGEPDAAARASARAEALGGPARGGSPP